MMTEKRFRKLQGFMADNNRKYDNGDVYAMDFTEVEDMLNGLYEENEDFRQRIKEFQRSREYWIQDNNRLTKRYNELIAKIEGLSDKIDEQQADLNYLAKLIGEFKVEEFRLKLRNLRILEDKVLEQQDTIEKQKRIIKSQDAEISRQYKLCLAMSGVLREEFGVYDVFDRTKDKKI